MDVDDEPGLVGEFLQFRLLFNVRGCGTDLMFLYRSIRVAQARIWDHVRSSRRRAFARMMSFRMMATSATFGGFPAAISWSYFAVRSGLKRTAASAGM